MKKFGFMLMAAAAVAMSFSSCKKDNKEEEMVIPTPTPVDIETPAVEGTEGAVTIVVLFDQAPCEGYDIHFVGDYRDNSWSIADAPSFEEIGDGWYKFVAYPNEGGTISGRPIQSDGVVAVWSYDWSHNPEEIIDVKGIEEGMKVTNEYGETNLQFTEAHAADAAVVYFWCKKWNTTPCATAEKYTVTILTPEFCTDYELELIGSFNDWAAEGTIAMTKVEDGKYTAEVETTSGNTFKVRGAGTGDWTHEIQKFNAESGEWGGIDNEVFGDNLNITVDYSDASVYRWSTCAEPAEAVPAGEGTFVVKITNREWNPADECIFTGNFEDKAWDASDRKMTYDRATQTWSWTGAYPENFEYKVIYNGTWATGANVKFDGVTYEAEFTIAEE